MIPEYKIIEWIKENCSEYFEECRELRSKMTPEEWEKLQDSLDSLLATMLGYQFDLSNETT